MPPPPAEATRSEPPPPELSLVLPIYNEELVLERSLATIVAFAERLGRAFELVCVDDGSRDKSAAILAQAARRDGRIRALSHAKNQGKGAAVRTGMLAARGQLLFFMDADLSTPLEELNGFIGALEAGYDVVLGNRRIAGASVERRQPWLRETLGKGFTFLTQRLLAPGIQDFTCGFKGFRRAAARAIFARSTLDGWAFDAELVVIAQVQGHRLLQLPVRWRHEDDTKVRLVSAVLGSAAELVQILLNRLRGRYRLPD